jgi:hypothetical protein
MINSDTVVDRFMLDKGAAVGSPRMLLKSELCALVF